MGRVESAVELVQVVEPAVGLVFFISAFAVFVFSLETRIKRERTLTAIHELRSIAHVVDMHQLTKDPTVLVGGSGPTASSPVRTMTDFELGPYLDYCSELVSLVAKLATLYIQDFPDATAVDDIEALTTGLSRKMWQKVMLLPRIRAANAGPDAESYGV